MTIFRRVCLWGIVILFAGTLIGCGILHNLQPHRLARLNHGINGTPASDYE